MSREMRFSTVSIIESMIENGHFSDVGDVVQAKADLKVHYNAGRCSKDNYEYLLGKLENLEKSL